MGEQTRMLALTPFIVMIISMPVLCSALGKLCTKHPLYDKMPEYFQSELVRSWNYARIKEGALPFEASFYQPGYTNHTYVPASGDDPHKFRHLDLFVTDHSLERRRARHARRHKKHARGKGGGEEAHVFLSFQREARVYIMVHSVPHYYWRFAKKNHKKSEARVRLPGWKSEGWAELESDNSRDLVSLGFTRSVRGRYARIAFVFSRSGYNVTLPARSWVKRKLKGVPTRRGKYTVLVSEANGYASKRPRLSPALAAKQTSVRAGERCPSWLHDTWAVDGDETDPHTAGVRFRTHHPLWDPCFWCAYDHEHGSDASALMGYTPRFGYTALKNGREDESHTGFKGFVLQLRDGLRMYYMVHAKLSEARRFSAQRHTVVVAVTNSSDKNSLLLELSFKADFGFASARAAHRRGVVALSTHDAALRAKARKARGALPMRLLNVIDPSHLDGRFSYNKRDLKRGRSEHWFALPICATSRARRGARLEIKNPSTALRRTAAMSRNLTRAPLGDTDLITLGVTRHR
eukprot:IDg23621t1